MQTRRRRRQLDSPLRTLRRVRTITQAQMATLLDVSQAHYSKYETGELLPPPEQRARIAAILGTSAPNLWPRVDSEPLSAE